MQGTGDPLLDYLAAGQDPAHIANLNQDFAARLRDMFGAAPAGLTINSGYRSEERQSQLWEEALAKYGDPEIADNWVARPGTSNHNHGAAVDLGYASPEVEAWVHANAGDYGLHFPMEWEDWHIEMVDGQPTQVPNAPGTAPTPGGMLPPPDMPPPAPPSLPQMIASAFAPAQTQAAPRARAPLPEVGNVQNTNPNVLAALLDEVQTASSRPRNNRLSLPNLLG